MTDAMVHRGPDDSGQCIERADGATVGFGHRRLSILDVSDAGKQPMVDPETGAVLLYNGEIYNFRALRSELEAQGCSFRGHSDTEVLLQGLVREGPAYLERICGMFAFDFYDPRQQRVLLARDPMGIKPLYMARTDGALVFASELRGLLASGLIPPKVDRRAVAGFLAYGAVQEPDTMVEGVTVFPPASWQWIDLETGVDASPEPQRFWTMPVPVEMTEREAVERYRASFDVAVREHLESDVPLAVLLSSGLDSTVIAGLAAQHASDLRTFTVGFSDHADLDESSLAEETAELFGAKHTTVTVSEADCEPLVQVWLESLDQPSIDGLNVYLISKFIAQHEITVVLSGLGGDEIFGGYPSFRDVPRLLRILKWTPRVVRGLAGRLLGMGRSEAVRLKLADIFASDGDVLSVSLHRRRTMSDRQLADLGLDAEQLGLHRLFVPKEAIDRVGVRPTDPLWSVSQAESRFYEANMLLRDSDANGMAHSLEIRVPFLDRRVLDFGFSVPDHIKLPDGVANKHLTLKAFDSLLRPALTQEGKKTFTLPIRRWMRGPLNEMCVSGLARLKASGVVRPEAVDAIWQEFERNPESPIWTRAWSLCVLGIYLEQKGLTR